MPNLKNRSHSELEEIEGNTVNRIDYLKKHVGEAEPNHPVIAKLTKQISGQVIVLNLVRGRLGRNETPTAH